MFRSIVVVAVESYRKVSLAGLELGRGVVGAVGVGFGVVVVGIGVGVGVGRCRLKV